MGACRSCSLGNGDGFHPPQWQPVAFPTRSAGRSWLFFSPSDGDGGKNQSAARWTGWKSIQVPESSGMHHPAKRPEGGGGGALGRATPTPWDKWILVPASHPLPSPLPPPQSPWVWLQALGNETFPAKALSDGKKTPSLS